MGQKPNNRLQSNKQNKKIARSKSTSTIQRAVYKHVSTPRIPSVDTSRNKSKRIASSSLVTRSNSKSGSLIPNSITKNSDESDAVISTISVGFAGFDVSDLQRSELNISPCEEKLPNGGDDCVTVESSQTITENLASNPVTNGSKEDENNNGLVSEVSASNPGTWSATDVFDYFRAVLPTASHALLEQDINGRALLLITRQDIMNLVWYQVRLPDKAPITLGTALNIYDHVVRLQTRSKDFRPK